MFKPKFSVILSNVGSCCDRYCTMGYSSPFTLEQLFERVSRVKNIEGVELIAGSSITEKNVSEIRNHLSRTGLKLVSIIPEHFADRKWGKGAFISKDDEVRSEAIEHTKEMMDAAAELGCETVSLWPGQDGYDYYFQADYIHDRDLFTDGVKQCCKYRKDVKISIEYKPKEPRNRSYPSNVTGTLLMVQDIGEDNCGVTIDYGHALTAYENVAESVALLKKYDNKLFHVHMNDNYTLWDDDMITGSIHTIPYIEFFYWLDKTEYNGYISTDQYPYREDSLMAVCESINWMRTFSNIANKIDKAEVEAIYHSSDAVAASRMLRKYLFGASTEN
jgi:sugar phosphate isomerase/epimerase